MSALSRSERAKVLALSLIVPFVVWVLLWHYLSYESWTGALTSGVAFSIFCVVATSLINRRRDRPRPR